MSRSVIYRDDILRWIVAYAGMISQNREYLTSLDSDTGDGDHGTNMERGCQAVLAALPAVADKDIGSILKTVGMTLLSKVGGASGPLYGVFFLRIAHASTGKTELTLADWISVLEIAVNGLMQFGKVKPGDKTMVDALVPALQALKDAHRQDQPLCEALQRCVVAGEQGMQSTITLVAHKGRACYLSECSTGHLDPGAVSAYLLLKAAAAAWVNP